MAPANERAIQQTVIGDSGTKGSPLPSIGEIRKRLPSQCFERSATVSLYFMVQDLFILFVLYKCYDVLASFGLLGYLVYWNLMGVFMSSVFCIGHDCGHGSFSEHKWLNDICGHLCHVPLLSPYWPWQKSHRLHHTYTSHLTKDKGHPWVTKEQFDAQYPFFTWISKNPISAFFRWLPMYTLVGIPDGSHFYPFGRLFSNAKERVQCAISGSLCALWLYLVWVHFEGNVLRMLGVYVVPLLVHGFWLIMLTYLHHQDYDVEAYEEDQWTFVRGAFQTVDRPYGFGLDYALHHITDGHVAHHLFFTQIPHYRLGEATDALRTILAPYKGLYKRRRSYNFLWKFIKLNYVLDYVVGQGVLKYPAERRKKHRKKTVLKKSDFN